MENFKIAVSLLVFLLFSIQGVVFADEIYQDENGVWTNRPKSGVVESTQEGLEVIGKTAYDGLNTVSEGLYSTTFKIMDATVGEAARAPLLKMKREGEARVEENRIKAEEKKRRRFEKSHVNDVSSYEQFDVSNAGEVKSEWEFFEDPRQ